MILEHFHEDPTSAVVEVPCCDVCLTESQHPRGDATKEVQLVVQAVKDMPGYGEVKVSVLSLTGLHAVVKVYDSGRRMIYVGRG